jgi:hypothetical protein
MLKVVRDVKASNENTTGAAGGSLLDQVVRADPQVADEFDRARRVSHSTTNLTKGQPNDRAERGTCPASDRRTDPTSGRISRRGRA